MGREIVSIATALVPYPPERVWAVVTDLDCWRWRGGLSRLDHVGEDAFYGVRQKRLSHPLHRHGAPPPVPLGLFDLDNANLAGRWAGEFRPEGGGTQVTFTETITVKSPGCASLPRGYLRRQQARYLADLGRALEQKGRDLK
ncbi:MAG: SRPBCC family protein [Dysosmobacter welbionis]